MKKIITFLLVLFAFNSNAQIGDGWDWAFNTGSFGGTTFKHLKYTADGSEIMMGGQALGAAYFGATTISAPAQGTYAGNIKFFGKINATTNAQTIIRSFINIPVNFDCITTDDAGNFYIGGAFVSTTDFDFGNGVTVVGAAFKMNVIAKFDPLGNTLWAKTFQMGATGSASNNVIKLAVSNAGNVFFWGFNPNADANGKRNAPLYKLDSNGNTIWFKDALNNSGIVSNVNSESYLSDKFIDANENVHLFVSTASTLGFAFNGISYPTSNASSGSSTLISLNSNGDLITGQTFQGGVTHFQVNRNSGNLIFGWSQFNANPGAFQSLPHPLASLIPSYANAFTGIMEITNNLSFVKAKDYSTTADNPFQITGSGNRFLSLPNGKLLIATKFYKNAAYNVGVNSMYPADATKYASAIIETDINWGLEKFIFGGKAADATQDYLLAYNDTYLIASGFYAEEPGYFTSNPPLPTTSFGSVNLTGFNAASDFTTAYTFSNSSSFRFDVALAQCKSANFPSIGFTTWLGSTNNWNTPTNWSNGVPTNNMKAIFSGSVPNNPSISTSPNAATLEIMPNTSVILPANIVLTGGVKNEGTISINNAGFFQGFGAKEWKGSGIVNFTGSAVSYFYGNLFTNNLVLNTNLTTQYDLRIPTITLNNSKVNLNNKLMSITDASPTAISGASLTNYIYGGTLERKINTSGSYEFPMGDFNYNQAAIIDANTLVGVDKLSATFTAGAITGTTPSTSYNGVAITSALNGGWFKIYPNAQPTAGSYDVTLKIQNSTNTSANVGEYIVIKRDNSTSPWAATGVYNLGSTSAGVVTVKNSNLTSFSDFAIGKGGSDISLSNESFQQKSITLFPNPVSNNLTILYKNNFEKASMKIISITGQVVKEHDAISGDTISLDVSDLSKGIYIIQILDNNSILTSKFIKD
jgi:hypothetical protein